MNKTDAEMQVKGINELIAKRLKRLEEARRAQIKGKVTFERDQENLGKTIRDLKVVLAQDPSMNTPDPRTGKSNEEWRGWMIEQAIEKDPDYIAAVGAFYGTQEAYYASEMELLQAGEELNALKTEAILLGALLRYVSSPE